MQPLDEPNDAVAAGESRRTDVPTAVPLARPVTAPPVVSYGRPAAPPGVLGLGRGLAVSLGAMGAYALVIVSAWLVAFLTDTVEPFLRWGIGPAEVIVLLVLPVLLTRLGGGTLRASFALRPSRPILWAAAFLLGLSWVGLFQLLAVAVQRWANVTDEIREMLAPLLTVRSDLDWIRAVGMIAITPAICEEAVFRGLFQQTLQSRMRWWPAALISAAAFAVFHLDPLNFGAYLLLGLCLSVIVARTRCLWYAVAVHFWVNLSALLLANLVPPWVHEDTLVSPQTILLFAVAAAASMWLWLRLTRPASAGERSVLASSATHPRGSLKLAWAAAAAATIVAFAAELLLVRSRKLDGLIVLLNSPYAGADQRALARVSLDQAAARLSSEQLTRVTYYALQLVMADPAVQDAEEVRWGREWLRRVRRLVGPQELAQLRERMIQAGRHDLIGEDVPSQP